MRRLLVPTIAPGLVRVDGPRARHLATVLRVKPGDAVEVFDGQGSSSDAIVEALDDGAVTLKLGPTRATTPMRKVTVVQGLPKGDKLELVLQKGTELGATAFVPAPARRSVAKLDDKIEKKLERWRRIVEEAARQSGRSDVPEVLAPVKLEAVSFPGALVLVLDEEERARSLSLAVAPLAPDHPLVLVIGPEGGLDRAEVDALQARGALPVSLGHLVLRTETAALAALTVIRHLDGVLG